MQHTIGTSLLKVCAVCAAMIGSFSGPAQAQQAEFRGMWVSRYDGWASPDKAEVESRIDEIMTKLADANFNSVMFQVRGQADTFYPSPYEPWAPAVSPGWTDFDPLAHALQAAHSRGLEFHAYINTHTGWAGSSVPGNGQHLYYRHLNAANPATRDWLIHNSWGQPVQLSENYVWIAPGVPAAQAYIRQQAMYVVTTYNVDGVHFDRIRTPGSGYSYDPISLSRYNGTCNPDSLSFNAWTADQITRMLRDLYAQIAEVKPALKVSAAPFGWGWSNVNQNPAEWFSSGVVDALVPMTYGSYFDYFLPYWLDMRAGRHLYAGQDSGGGIYGYIDDIILTRSLGGQGTTFFSYGSFDSNGYWDIISAPGAPYELPAAPPAMAWKNSPTFGIIIGNVVGLDGLPAVDARVQRNGSNYVAFSSGDGLYSFLGVAPGDYTLTFSGSDFSPLAVSGVSVAAGAVTRVDVVVGDGAYVQVQAAPVTARRARPIRFTPSVTVATGSGVHSYTWRFGDGELSGNGTPGLVEHAFAQAGNYDVSLEVVTSLGHHSTSLPVTVLVRPFAGDFDNDGDVDQADFGEMQRCLTGVGNSQPDASCLEAKLDGDDDVDFTDMGLFIDCLSGPGQPAGNCPS